ncbi:GTPase IMAP family member 8-like [Sardina pilchardus]|uniref:GTPase IMAP family member 8-like n=1 Tax=Sardina pilchardus TaxID=27697 RepID=UPI002E104222
MATPECKAHLGYNAQSLSELKIVLLGYRAAGKSSSGNTILGRQKFDAVGRRAQCVKRQGDVGGRQVTVVEAPGWLRDAQLKDTPELTKEEIELSVSLCPPGPHALLLVIRVETSFLETERRSVEEHLELLSESVWSHTIVLFTFGDWLGDTSIEQHIEREGDGLQWLVEKCGNRYHVLNNHKRYDHMQITQLMEKIEEMVAGNSETHHLSVMRIVLLGYRAAGKSSSGNTILGRPKFDAVKTTAQCVKRQREVGGRQVTVVEAPGWLRDAQLKDTPELTKKQIELSVSLCPPGPHALLLVIRVETSFSETERQSVEEHLELLSESVWSHTIVLFTFGDWLGDTPIEQHIEREGESLQWLIEKCGNRYHVLNNQKRYDHMQITQLMEKIEEMVAGNSKSHHLSKLRIVFLGYKISGKSSSMNSILGREEFDTERPAQCVKRQGDVGGRQVTVVEAPGWLRDAQLKDTPELTKEQIKLSVSLCPPGPHALLLAIPVDTSLSETGRKSVQEHLELLSGRVWSHTIVLFTCGDWLGETPIEQHIESEGESLQWLVEKCGNRYHVLNNQNRDDHMQVTQLMEKIEEMVTGNSGQHYEIALLDADLKLGQRNYKHVLLLKKPEAFILRYQELSVRKTQSSAWPSSPSHLDSSSLPPRMQRSDHKTDVHHDSLPEYLADTIQIVLSRELWISSASSFGSEFTLTFSGVQAEDAGRYYGGWRLRLDQQ